MGRNRDMFPMTVIELVVVEILRKCCGLCESKPPFTIQTEGMAVRVDVP